MPDCCRSLSEHDLTLHLVRGEHPSAEGIRSFEAMDSTCATRWLSYFDPTVELQIPVADMPRIKRVIYDKRRELFVDKPKRYAIVCGDKATADYFCGFWRRYFPSQSDELRCFCSLDEAYDWLGLSEAGRVAVASAIDDWHAEGAGLERIEPRPSWTGGDPGGEQTAPVRREP